MTATFILVEGHHDALIANYQLNVENLATNEKLEDVHPLARRPGG